MAAELGVSYLRESPSVPVSYFSASSRQSLREGEKFPWISKLKFDIRTFASPSTSHPLVQSIAPSRQHGISISISQLPILLHDYHGRNRSCGNWNIQAQNEPTRSNSNLVLLNQTPSINRKHGYLSRFSSQAQRYRCQARLLPQEEVRHHPSMIFFSFLSFRVVYKEEVLMSTGMVIGCSVGTILEDGNLRIFLF